MALHHAQIDALVFYNETILPRSSAGFGEVSIAIAELQGANYAKAVVLAEAALSKDPQLDGSATRFTCYQSTTYSREDQGATFLPSMMLPSIPGLLWAPHKLLVHLRRATKPALPQSVLKLAFAARVKWVVTLLRKREHFAASADAHLTFWSPASDEPHHGPRTRRKTPGIFLSYGFWPGTGELPTVRQVRQAIEDSEDSEHGNMAKGAHAPQGVIHPARAATAAGWGLAR